MGAAGRRHVIAHYARPVVTARYDALHRRGSEGTCGMKRLLVLGGGGMLGHKLWQLAARSAGDLGHGAAR